MKQLHKSLQGTGNRFWLPVTRFLDIKENWMFGEIMLEKEILKCFHYFLCLRVWKDIRKSQNYLKIIWKYYKTKLISALPFNTNLWQGEGSFLCIFFSAWDLHFEVKGKILTAEVWLYTQDEIHRSAHAQVLDFCFLLSIRRHWTFCCTLNFLHVQVSIFLFNMHQSRDRNCVISMEGEICKYLSQIWHRKQPKNLVQSINKQRFHIKEVSFSFF